MDSKFGCMSISAAAFWVHAASSCVSGVPPTRWIHTWSGTHMHWSRRCASVCTHRMYVVRRCNCQCTIQIQKYTVFASGSDITYTTNARFVYQRHVLDIFNSDWGLYHIFFCRLSLPIFYIYIYKEITKNGDCMVAVLQTLTHSDVNKINAIILLRFH